jgi:hypothetical protein
VATTWKITHASCVAARLREKNPWMKRKGRFRGLFPFQRLAASQGLRFVSSRSASLASPVPAWRRVGLDITCYHDTIPTYPI